MIKKTCNKCQIEKEINEFYLIKSTNTYRGECKLCLYEKSKKRKSNNLEKYSEISRKYRLENRELLIKRSKEYREKNRDRCLNNIKDWVKKNYEKYLEKKREYSRSEQGKLKKMENYYKNKEQNKHIIAWRTILNNTLKRLNTIKEGKTIELLGYSATELKEHIESKFLEGMSWENRSEWHIDHIKPVSSFDKSEKMSIINSLDNLQPLWAVDNLKKSNKY